MTDLSEAGRRLLDRCEAGEEIEVYARHQVVTTVSAGTGGELRGISRGETSGVGVRVIVADREGYASTSDLAPAALQRCLAQARANAALAEPDETSRLPEPQPLPELPGLWRPELGRTSITTKIALMTRLARQAGTLDPRVATVESATYSDDQSSVAVCSTRGVSAHYRRGVVEISLEVIGDDGDHPASGSSDWSGRAPQDCDLDSLAEQAVRHATRLLGPRQPVPRDVPLLLGPPVAAVFLAAVGRAFTAPALLAHRGPFAGRLQTPVASDAVTLTDEGTDLASPLAAPFDDEGTPRGRTDLIVAGTAVGVLHSVQTARAAGDLQRSTGNARRGSHKSPPVVAATSVRLEPGADATGLTTWPAEAIYIDQIGAEGSGISPLTGRVDLAAVGFVVRDGVPAGAFKPCPFSTTLGDLIAGVLAVGADARAVPGHPVIAPTLLLRPGLV